LGKFPVAGGRPLLGGFAVFRKVRHDRIVVPGALRARSAPPAVGPSSLRQ
jgi:hypothetical protein